MPRRITVAIDDDQYVRLKQGASSGLPIASVVRMAIEDYLTRADAFIDCYSELYGGLSEGQKLIQHFAAEQAKQDPTRDGV